jgi:hypothetical protein
MISLLMLASCSGQVVSLGLVDAVPVSTDGAPGFLGDAGFKIDAGTLPDGGPACQGSVALFRDMAYPTIFAQCVGCHSSGGQAGGTHFLLRPFLSNAALIFDVRAVSDASSLMTNGQPLLLLKSTGGLAHGGGKLFSPQSAEALLLTKLLAELKTPILCPGDEFPRPQTTGVTELTPVETLYKMSFQIAGRVPTPAEVASVETQGLPALDSIVTAHMKEPNFEERLREMLGDWLLTDAFRANNIDSNTDNILGAEFHAPGLNRWGGLDYDWRQWPNGEGIELVEALGREPAQFAVYAFQNDKPMSEILTAKYRLLNAYSARFYKVPYKGFAPGTPFSQIPNPQEFVAVGSVPNVNENASSGEYAGILTTTAWLNRYPSSPTNFNRKRARFTLKYFMNYDIMKAAPRIDASAVNLADHPTVNNAVCASCHETLDPLAGLYLNEDECGYEARVFYGPVKGAACSDNGWQKSIDMFPPGTGPGPLNQISLAQRPKALEVLAASIAGERSFAKSMTTMVYTALLNRPLLVPPRDVNSPAFDALFRASDFEAAQLEGFTSIFIASGLRLPALLTAIVRSEAFRTGNADATQRSELNGLGGGTLVTPEVLNRKIESTLGLVWAEHGWRTSPNTGYQALGRHDGTRDAYLVQRDQFKTLYGGMDGTFTGIKARQRGVSSLSAAIIEHMALETSCLAVTRDFERPAPARLLFSLVDKAQLPSGMPAQDSAILQTIQKVEERLLGTRAALSSPDITELYSLFLETRNAGAAAVTAGTESAALERPCSSDLNLETGLTSSVSGIVRDETYVVRAWQAVLAAVLLDPRFTLER